MVQKKSDDLLTRVIVPRISRIINLEDITDSWECSDGEVRLVLKSGDDAYVKKSEFRAIVDRIVELGGARL